MRHRIILVRYFRCSFQDFSDTIKYGCFASILEENPITGEFVEYSADGYTRIIRAHWIFNCEFWSNNEIFYWEQFYDSSYGSSSCQRKLDFHSLLDGCIFCSQGFVRTNKDQLIEIFKLLAKHSVISNSRNSWIRFLKKNCKNLRRNSLDFSLESFNCHFTFRGFFNDVSKMTEYSLKYSIINETNIFIHFDWSLPKNS